MSQNRIFVEFGQIRLCICEYGTLRIFLFISNMNIVLVFKLYIHHIITRATISFHTTNSYSNETNISYPLLKIQINFSTGMLSIMNSDTINIWMIIMLFNKLSRLSYHEKWLVGLFMFHSSEIISLICLNEIIKKFCCTLYIQFTQKNASSVKIKNFNKEKWDIVHIKNFLTNLLNVFRIVKVVSAEFLKKLRKYHAEIHNHKNINNNEIPNQNMKGNKNGQR